MLADPSAISAHYISEHAPKQFRAPPPMRREHPDARHECEVCGRKFTLKKDVPRHMAAVHGIGDVKIYQCDVCSRIFKYSSSVTKHLRSAHGVGEVKSFKCKVCSKAFKLNSTLKKHMRETHDITDV